MNKSKSFTSFLIALLFLFFLSPAALAMDKQFFEFWEVVDCPNELVYLEGGVRFQFQATGQGWVYQAFWTGGGWGVDSDSEYVIQGKWQEVVQEKRPFIWYWNDHFEMAGKGSAPTYKFYSRIRFNEFDEDGAPIPEFISAEWPCATIAFDIWPAE